MDQDQDQDIIATTVAEVKNDGTVTREDLLEYIEAHLRAGTIDLDDFVHYFIVD